MPTLIININGVEQRSTTKQNPLGCLRGTAEYHFKQPYYTIYSEWLQPTALYSFAELKEILQRIPEVSYIVAKDSLSRLGQPDKITLRFD